MDEIEVPTYFLCPISLEIMKNPVILSTGITYDRTSIEKWIFSEKNNNCPVTKQTLSDAELIPNHTLRRLIQSWCTLNASFGIDRIPTPKPPISKPQILKLLTNSKSPNLQMQCLRSLKSLASENESNKRHMEAAGAAEFLASIITNAANKISSNEVINYDDEFERTKPVDEALSILFHLQLSETSLNSLIDENGQFIESLMHVMQGDNYESRTYSLLLLKSILKVANPTQMINLRRELFYDLVQVLRGQISHKVSKAALQLLINICPAGRNRVKAVEAGAVSLMIDFLLDHSSERRICEMVLVVLDQLCQCAEGRAEFLKHGAGLAVVSKKILRVSDVANDRGVRILLSIAKFSGSSSRVVQEMLQLGVVAKLCLVMQVDCGRKIKEKASEILKLHGRAWKNSACVPMSLLSSCPSRRRD